MHLLSGGLDSSLVLASLRRTVDAHRIKCLTFTQGDGSELDEVRYAQLAADASGVDLSVARFDASRVHLERASEQVSQPRPLGYTFSIDNDDAELEFANACGASVCTSGAGGDGLFYQLRARTYVADYLSRHGPSWGAARVAFDSARLARVSVWTCLHEGWKFAYGGAAFAPEQAMRNPYLSEGLDEPQTSWIDVHPWFNEAERLSPGKKLHLWTVLDCLNLFYPYRRSAVAQTELPLVSQPIIETVLRIPSWVLSNGGRDRTLVREACSDIVPAPILSRSGKGAMDGYYAELCAANAVHLREALLDGVLVKRGILSGRALEHDLPRGRDPRDGRELLLLQAFAAEVWANAWAGTPVVAPA
jgi:asparagine synthase (glutamine-hydrolysing)